MMKLLSYITKQESEIALGKKSESCVNNLLVIFKKFSIIKYVRGKISEPKIGGGGGEG